MDEPQHPDDVEGDPAYEAAMRRLAELKEKPIDHLTEAEKKEKLYAACTGVTCMQHGPLTTPLLASVQATGQPGVCPKDASQAGRRFAGSRTRADEARGREPGVHAETSRGLVQVQGD